MSGLSLAALISPRRRTTPTPPQQANSSSQGEGGDVELGGSRGGGGRVSSGESAASAQAHLDAPTPATNENGQPTHQTPSPEQNSEAARDAAGLKRKVQGKLFSSISSNVWPPHDFECDLGNAANSRALLRANANSNAP